MFLRLLFIGVLCCLPFHKGYADDNASPIKIGDISAYTGLSNYAQAYKQGWQLALEEINSSGGVLGRPLEIISRDSRGNPSDAISVAQDLIYTEKVFALMGPLFSHVGLAVSEISKREKVPLITAIAGSDKLLWDKWHPYVFRIYGGTYSLSSTLLTAAEDLPYTKWGIIAENYEAGHAYADAIKERLAIVKPDAEIVVEQYPALGRMDAGSVLQAIKKDKPEALFVFLLGSNMSAFVRELKIRGLDDIVIFNPSLGFPEEYSRFGDELPKGWYVLSIPEKHKSGKEYKDFYEAYENKYEEIPGFTSIIGYLSLKSIASALEKAGKVDREKFVAAMVGDHFDFVNGPFSIRAIDHQSNFAHTVARTDVVNGQPALRDIRFLKPEDHLASEDYVIQYRKDSER